jgi:hypothetical protein
MRPKGINEWHICRVTSSRDHDAADARHIIAWIKRVPSALKVDFDPGTKIHRVDNRDADISKMSIDVARWYIKTPAKRECEVSKIPAHANSLVEGLKGCSC